VVWDLFPSAVDDMSNFIRHNELDVLGGELVSDKEAVLNLDGAYHVEVGSHLLLALRRHVLLGHWVSMVASLSSCGLCSLLDLFHI